MIRMATTGDDQRRDELNDAYFDSHAFVIHYLDEIGARIHDMPALESDGLNWAHVGDMNKIKNDLREIVEFLSGYSQ